jgi:hypothetical protein
MGDSSKGKTKASALLWRLETGANAEPHRNEHGAAGSAAHCLFEISPEMENYILVDYTKNLTFLKAGEYYAPWMGYYAKLNGHKLAVANYARMWFEIRRRKNSWEAYRPVLLPATAKGVGTRRHQHRRTRRQRRLSI